GGGVTTLGRFAMADRKIAEANETDVAAVLQFCLDDVEDCINCGRCVGLGKSGLFGNSRYELILVHVSTPFNTVRNDSICKPGAAYASPPPWQTQSLRMRGDARLCERFYIKKTGKN